MNKKLIVSLCLSVSGYNGFSSVANPTPSVSSEWIKYKIKEKDDFIKVTFKSKGKVSTNEPVVLRAALVNQAFADIEMKYGPEAKVKAKVKNKDESKDKGKKKNKIGSVETGALSNLPSLAELLFVSIPFIRTGAIQDCSNLEFLKFGGSGIQTEKDVVVNCTKLRVIEFGGAGMVIGDESFRGTSVRNVNLAGSGFVVGALAFAQNPNLGAVNIGGSGIVVGVRAFYQCPKLTAVSVGGTAIDIKEYAFANCESLGAVQIGGAGNKVHSKAFDGCPNLVLNTANMGDVNDDPTAFKGCTALATTSAS